MSAKKKPTETQSATPSARVNAIALVNLYEEGTVRRKGETFELDAARAAVLPELVAIVDAAADTPTE
jgi:hypothetical protein